ncbi:BRCA1-associated protein [Aplysia californica]|uniref:BRCA1-associated protein n=1 Tax=Aplysia californica TaxID=6500 RepID=A0ABM0JG90_APLCA|nr:BRCA1-associated protein [Aplysia californica]XP_005093001.1 BRCA1-associated protein [Aplysia californica]
MLISLITLRLELAHEAPQLKYFQTYTAKRDPGTSRTYASVARSGGHHPSQPSSSHIEGAKGDRRRHFSGHHSEFDIVPHCADEEESLVVVEAENKQCDNLLCQGQRRPRDISIEFIGSDVWQDLLRMSAESEDVDVAEEEEGRELAANSSAASEREVQQVSVKVHPRTHPSARQRESRSEPDDRPSSSHTPSSSTATPSGSGATRPKSHSPTGKMPSTINFFCGNPSVELTKGILHIYKDSQMTTLDKDVTRSEMLCMLGVPASYTIHDLINFAAPMGDYVKFMQVLRDAFPNQYLLLIKFRDQASTDEFYSYFNSRPFNSIEPDICHLVYVVKIEVTSDTECGSLPTMDLTELPNCPVCLERMEESVDGILTVLCNHSFHTHCLAQWGDTSCPVCRYIQTPEAVADQRCMQCGSHESLWICLICGNVGCGRYVGLHAYKHFQDTNHTYAMQLGTNRVWDYAGDNYVHRLAQNKSDGKLVQVDEGGNELREEKLDSITLEYTYLLTTQLESQRLYFMEQIQEAVKDVEAKLEESTERYEQEREEREKAECKLAELKKEKQTLDKKLTQLHTRTEKVMSELQEERQMNKCLRENQQQWQVRVGALEKQLKEITTKKDQEVKDLQEQLRDVMFYLEAQQKLANSPGVSREEIQDGQVIVGAAAASSKTPNGSTKKSRKKPQR